MEIISIYAIAAGGILVLIRVVNIINLHQLKAIN